MAWILYKMEKSIHGLKTKWEVQGLYFWIKNVAVEINIPRHKKKEIQIGDSLVFTSKRNAIKKKKKKGGGGGVGRKKEKKKGWVSCFHYFEKNWKLNMEEWSNFGKINVVVTPLWKNLSHLCSQTKISG